MTKDSSFFNKVSGDRISSRQIDEMIGLARGLCADGVLNQAEVEFLQGWLAASLSVNDQPLLQTIWMRVSTFLRDGVLDQDEQKDLFETLNNIGGRDFELGESLKSTTLPLCNPAPSITIKNRQFVFTGTFSYGRRKDCERAVLERGGEIGTLTRKTDYLVIGNYATDSWKHSSMGVKILRACELREGGIPISIVSESHWAQFL